MRRAAIPALLILALSAPAAWAHAVLEQATPRVGSTVATGPTTLTLTFSEPVVLAVSRMSLTDAAGKPLPLGPLAWAAGDRKRLTAPIPTRLAPGLYRVSWRVVSADTHVTQGRFEFRVAGP